MPLRESDKALTAFVVPWCQNQWKRGCPFGLQGAPSTFQSMMMAILGESQYSEALCYLDDITVWGRDWSEHMACLRNIFGKLKTAGVVLSPGKCVFGAKRVEYLGHAIEAGRVMIREEQLRSLSRPKTVMQLRQALGAFAYVQRWLPGMAEIHVAKPLYDALEQNGRQRLVWTEAMCHDFEELKNRTANAVALHIPDCTKKFVLVTDASDQGVGAMLANENGGMLKPTAFFIIPSLQQRVGIVHYGEGIIGCDLSNQTISSLFR